MQEDVAGGLIVDSGVGSEAGSSAKSGLECGRDSER
jgi:hypothetical protein